MYVTVVSAQMVSGGRPLSRLGFIGDATPVTLASAAPMHDGSLYVFTFQSLSVAPTESTLMDRLRGVNTIEPRKIDRAYFSNQYDVTFIYHGSGETVGSLGLRMQQALSLWYSYGSFQFQKAVGYAAGAQEQGAAGEDAALPKHAPILPQIPTADLKKWVGPALVGVFGLAGLMIATR